MRAQSQPPTIVDAPTGIPGTSVDSGAAVEDAPIDAGPPVDAAPGVDAAALEMNPYGRPYPTKYIGWGERNGDAAGYVIANLKFPGYRIGATTPETISLALVYDPEGRTHDIVVLITAGVWDSFSTKTMKALKPNLPGRVAFVGVLSEGAEPGVGATLSDLDPWRLQLPNAIHVIDPQVAALKPLGELAIALPGIVILDARTMEIVSGKVGAPLDPVAVIETARDTIKARPPAY